MEALDPWTYDYRPQAARHHSLGVPDTRRVPRGGPLLNLCNPGAPYV
jgi:hypothetical protein